MTPDETGEYKMSQTTFAVSGPVLLPTGQIEDATVYLSAGQIQRVERGRDPGADLSTEGAVLPGLIDLQVNGAYGFDFTNDASTVLEVAARLPATGVTAYMPTVITSRFESYPARVAEISQAAREAQGGARILGVHLEGPYLNPRRKGAHPAECLRPIDVEEIRRWAADGAVRIVTLAPELDGALEAARALRAMGKVVSAGHSDATFEQGQAAFAAGVNWATHLYNAQSALGHREPGMMGAILLSDVPCGLIVDGIHSHPAMVQLAWKLKGTQGIVLVTDCMAAMGMAPGSYELGHYNVIVNETSARLPDGTLAGSILRMDEAVRSMIDYTGCTLADAAQMASTAPARLMGLRHLGMLAPGCAADLVVLSPDLQVTHTFIGGALAYQR
jgi:N-acetylglucosamine-6-phosphate deacetylase